MTTTHISKTRVTISWADLAEEDNDDNLQIDLSWLKPLSEHNTPRKGCSPSKIKSGHQSLGSPITGEFVYEESNYGTSSPKKKVLFETSTGSIVVGEVEIEIDQNPSCPVNLSPKKKSLVTLLSEPLAPTKAWIRDDAVVDSTTTPVTNRETRRRQTETISKDFNERLLRLEQQIQKEDLPKPSLPSSTFLCQPSFQQQPQPPSQKQGQQKFKKLSNAQNKNQNDIPKPIINEEISKTSSSYSQLQQKQSQAITTSTTTTHTEKHIEILKPPPRDQVQLPQPQQVVSAQKHTQSKQSQHKDGVHREYREPQRPHTKELAKHRIVPVETPQPQPQPLPIPLVQQSELSEEQSSSSSVDFSPIELSPKSDNHELSSSPREDHGPEADQENKEPKGVETNEQRLKQRQKQIDYGRNTVGYHRYLDLVPKPKRKRRDPHTPDKLQVCSKRSWDAQVQRWRRLLHQWDPPEEFSTSATATIEPQTLTF